VKFGDQRPGGNWKKTLAKKRGVLGWKEITRRGENFEKKKTREKEKGGSSQTGCKVLLFYLRNLVRGEWAKYSGKRGGGSRRTDWVPSLGGINSIKHGERDQSKQGKGKSQGGGEKMLGVRGRYWASIKVGRERGWIRGEKKRSRPEAPKLPEKEKGGQDY